MGWATDSKHLDVDLKKKKFPEDDTEEDEEEYEGSEANGYSSKHRPDGGWGWMVLLASFTCNLIVDGVGFSFGAAQMEYMEIFNASFTEISWVGSSLTGSYLIVGPVVGLLCFRFGMRTVTIAGSIVATVGFALSSQATSLSMLILTYGVIGGIGLGMMYLPSIVCVSYWFEKKLGIATGIAVCGSGLGQLIFPPLGEYLINEYQWSGKHLILSGIVLQGAVCGAIFRPPDQWNYRRQKRCKQRVEIERGIIMKALIEDKKRQRTISDGSLDNCVITTNNRLIKLEPSLFHCKKNQALRNMLRRLGYSIQSLAVSKNSLQTTDQLVLMEALQQQQQQQQQQQSKLDLESNGSAVNSKTNSPQFLLPVAQLQKRNSSPDFNKVSPDQQQSNGSVVRSNSVMSNGGVAGITGSGLANGVCSNGSNPPVRSFPKTKSCDALAQQPYMFIKKIMSDRVRSNSECVTTHSSNNLQSGQMIPLGSSPTLPVGSVDISIQEIAGSEAIASCYTSNTSVATDISSHCAREYEPNTSQNTFVATCMISGQQLEASIRELEKQDARENSYFLKWMGFVMDRVDMKLLCRPIFALFLLSSLFTVLAFYIPYYYIPNLGVNVGMMKLDAEFLPSILGITSTIGRLIVGWLGDRPWVNALHLNNGALICAGICNFILPFLKAQEVLCVFTAILGFCLAVFVALRSVLLVKFLGVELIPKSFGLLCLVQGIGAFAGSPLAGRLADQTKSLDMTFFVAGIFTVISGLLLLPLGYLKKKEDRLEQQRQAEEDAEADEMLGSAAAISSVNCPA